MIMKFKDFLLIVISVILVGLVAFSMIVPPGKTKWILNVMTIVFIFLFLMARVAAKKRPDKEDEPWDM